METVVFTAETLENQVSQEDGNGVNLAEIEEPAPPPPPPLIDMQAFVDGLAFWVAGWHGDDERREISQQDNWITIRNGEQTLFVCVMEKKFTD